MPACLLSLSLSLFVFVGAPVPPLRFYFSNALKLGPRAYVLVCVCASVSTRERKFRQFTLFEMPLDDLCKQVREHLLFLRLSLLSKRIS